MSAHRKPLRITAERFAELFVPDPAAEFGWRWRTRQLSEFGGDERSCAIWNAKHAGRAVGKQEGGRVIITVDRENYDLRRIMAELGEAIDAIVSSCPGNPDDAITNGDEAGSGKLANVILAASRDSGLRLDDLTVLSAKKDPFRLDTPKGHRLAQWFKEWFSQLYSSTAIVHLRGFHYVLVSHGSVEKPDGTLYENSDDDFKWLIDEAAKAARWLGYVGFDRIKDQKNDAPVILRHREPRTPTTKVFANLAETSDENSYWWRDLGDPVTISDCRPWASLNGFGAEQPYAFAFFGEKSSLEPVLDPIARRIEANMYLCSGEISDTLIFEMARDAAADPAGRQMPVSIGRKLQAFRDLLFPGLRAQVVPVSLTLEQVIAERLPTTPVKEGEARAGKWDRAFGPALRAAGLVDDRRPAQVEIDALASIRPDVLRRITLEKMALYRDETLERRTATRAGQWWAAARAEVDAQIDDDRLAEIKAAAEDAAGDFNAALADLAAAQNRLRAADADLDALCDEISVPEPPEPPEPEIDTSRHEPLVDLDWRFEDATAALKAHKRYGGEGEDEEAP